MGLAVAARRCSVSAISCFASINIAANLFKLDKFPEDEANIEIVALKL